MFCEVVFAESFEVTECWSIEIVVSVCTAKSGSSEGLSTGVQLTLATVRYLRSLPAGIPVVVYTIGRRIALLLRVIGANIAHPDFFFLACILFYH